MKAAMVGAMLVLVSTGCTPHPEPIAYQCPKIELPADPKLAIGNLKEGDAPDIVVKSLIASIVSLQGWNRAVRTQITASNPS